MKNMLTTALLVTLAVAGVQAQTNTFRKNDKNGLKLLPQNKQNTGSTNKATATYWRLAAMASYSDNGSGLELSDSSIYKYSNGRGSTFNTEYMSYETYGIYSEVKYDTAIQYYDMGSGIELSQKNTMQYDNNNFAILNAQEQYINNKFEPGQKTVAVRDANGNITFSADLVWNNSAWDTTNKSFKTYDAQMRMVSDSSVYKMGGMTQPGYAVHYTYDANGNATQILNSYNWNNNKWNDISRTSYTYNNGRVTTYTEQEYDGSVWENSYMDSLGYTSSGVLNYDLYKEWDNNKWVNSSLEVRTINNKGLATNIEYSEWNNTTKKWRPSYSVDNTYDANDNIETAKTYGYTGTVKDMQPSYINNYYYESYLKTGIADVLTNSSVLIYPNPASSYINVSAKDNNISKIALISMSGNVVRSMAAGSEAVSLPVSGLPAGNYIISIECDDKQPYRQLVTIQ